MTEEHSKKVTVEEESSKSTPNPAPRPSKRRMGIWASRKFLMTLVALGTNWSAYWAEIKYLYSFVMPEQINAFTGITRDFHWTMTAILLAYLGVQGAVDWRHGTTGAVTQAASFVREKIQESRQETRNEHVVVEQHIKEEGINAPDLKPFASNAEGDEEEGEYNDFKRKEVVNAEGH